MLGMLERCWRLHMRALARFSDAPGAAMHLPVLKAALERESGAC